MRSPRSMGLRIADNTAAALFAVAAALQLDDPDPVPWVAIYGAAGVAAAVAWRWRAGGAAAAALGIAALAWAIWTALRIGEWIGVGGLTAPMDETPGGSIELTREALGLVLVAGYMGFIALRTLSSRWS